MLRIGTLLTIVLLALACLGLVRFEYWRVDNHQAEQLSAKTMGLQQD